MQMIDLGGEWSLSRADKKQRIPATVPGCVHTDLMAAGKIADPFYRANETDCQWIGETDWVYRRTFDLPADSLRRDRVLLRCEGLDTFATLTLNGRRIAKTDNQHRTYEFDVKRLLKAGKNTVEVRFDSVIPYIRRQEAKRYLPNMGGSAIAAAAWPHVRKSACNFGWDWGPMATTAGIWRDIYLLAFDTARLADVRIEQDHSRGKVSLDVSAEVEATGRGKLTAAVTVTFGGRIVAEGSAPVRGGKAALRLPIKHPKLWWPAGMGDQPLYDVTVDLLDAGDALIDSSARRIGLRELKLVQKTDRWGESFHFEANGPRFFAKGANWIPADAWPTRLTSEDYERLIIDAVAANMNMLRIWGGGIYEADVFYDLCDELGICVWQDFMFACAGYPGYDEAFLDNVRAEVDDNVRRLRHHPSIALWCGNNEIEGWLTADEWGEDTMSWRDYKAIFDKAIPQTLRKLDSRPYIPGSPHSPGKCRLDYNGPDAGDAHLWMVWHGGAPFEWYYSSFHRFVSEFGFQSFPEPRTVRAYTDAADRNVSSPVMEHHQRSGIGNSKIMTTMLDWFRLPKDFDSTLRLSQIQQGLAIKTAVEHWRRHMPRVMGALYWQHNDCWPVASWASLDYFGRWKALHYAAKRFFAPVLVSAVEKDDTGLVGIHVTSELPAVTPAKLIWRLTTTDGHELAARTQRVQAPADASKRVEQIDLSDPLAKFGRENLLLWLELHVAGERVSDNLVMFAKPKRMDLPDPAITTKVKTGPDGCFEITLKAKRPALWAHLDTTGPEAFFTDNYLHLPPGQPRALIAQPTKPMTVAAFKKPLKVRSLVDTF